MSEKKIEQRLLGKSGISVTKMGIGLWAVAGSEWGPAQDKDSIAAMEAAIEKGVLFYDTADVYGNGHSEELLGQVMKGRRDKFVLATKIGWLNYDGEKNQTAYTTVDKLIADVDKSLKRLQTDYVDLIQRHVFYSEPTVEVFLEGFKKLKQQGKVRAYGVSTSHFDHLQEFNADGECDVLQIDYSILNRTSEQDILPYCQKNNIGVIIRGALAMGTLTGKFSKDQQFPDGDFRQNWIKNPDENKIFMEDLDKVERLKTLANDQRNLAQLALQFVMDHPAVSVVIPGAKNARQLESNIKAAYLPSLSQEDRKLIDAVTPPGGGRKIWPA